MPTIAAPGPPGPVGGGVNTTEGGAISSELKTGIIIATLFIPLLGPLLGIILGIVFMNDALPEKNAVGRTWLSTGIGAIVLQCAFAGCLR